MADYAADGGEVKTHGMTDPEPTKKFCRADLPSRAQDNVKLSVALILTHWSRAMFV
jgi:hypothetical protein